MVRIARFAALFVGFVTLFSFVATPLMLFPMFFMFSMIFSACLALLTGAYELRRVETQPPAPKPGVERLLSRLKTYSPPVMTPTLLSSNVDNHVTNVLNLILECNMLPTYQMIATEHQPFFNSVVPEVWHVLGLVLGKVSKLNTVKIISQDLVLILRKHFEHFRRAQYQEPVSCSTTFPDLNRFPYLRDTDDEVEFLRQAVDVLLCVCLPADLKQCNSLRLIVREYVIANLLQPVIERVCDPDYINQKLLVYLVKKEEEIKASTHHASYEDFMKEMNRCEDVVVLEQQRQFIIMDILHAKAVLRMKQASSKGLRVANFPVAIPADKAKALMERGDLMLYITQLTTAKNTCERRIRKFGGDGSVHQQHSVPLERTPSLPRAIPFDTIMRNDTALMYFLHYLEEFGCDHLLSFWTEVEMLQTLSGLELQKQMETIYNTYLAYDAKRQIYADYSLVGNVEAHLTIHADHTPDALYEVQGAVYDELYSQFYESFICSGSFRTFMDDEVEDDAALFQHPDGGSSISSHSFEEGTYQKRLKSLRKKLSDKSIALAEFPSVAASSSSSSSLEIHRKRLEKDRFEIQEEIKQLEYYVEHTGE